jgi:hypothetical protein
MVLREPPHGTLSSSSLKLLNIAPRLRDLLVLMQPNRFIEVATSAQADLDAQK